MEDNANICKELKNKFKGDFAVEDTVALTTVRWNEEEVLENTEISVHGLSDDGGTCKGLGKSSRYVVCWGGRGLGDESVVDCWWYQWQIQVRNFRSWCLSLKEYMKGEN